MVLQKRLDYGFNGYQVPPTPRATRSARRRSIAKSKTVDNQMCAFDLLATVAGNLLLEGDSSNSSAEISYGKEQCATLKDSIKKEQYSVDKPFDPKSCDQSFLVSELVKQSPILNNCLKESLLAQHDACSGHASALTSSECSVKVDSPEQTVGDGNKARLGSFGRTVNADLSGFKVSASCKLEDDNKSQMKTEPFNNGMASVRNMANMCGSDCHVTWDENPPGLVSSDHSVKLPLCRDHIPCGSSSVNKEDVKLDTRDDDENSGCTQPSTGNKAVRPLPCNGDRRIKKLMTSDYWKVSSPIKDDEHCNADAETRHVCHNTKNGYKRLRSLRDYPFKKRKLYYYSSVSNLDGGDNGEGICSSPGKSSRGDILAPVGTLQGVTGRSSSAAVERTSFQSRDAHVKLKIKTFHVPELFIEIPETATVGSLKRTVKEAVTAILGGRLRVGVLLLGKKIRDDNKTLLQAGISHGNKPDALGFTLEPDSSKAPPAFCSDGPPFLLPCDTPQPLKRYPAGPSVAHNKMQHASSEILPDPTVTNVNNFIESDHDSAPSPPDTSREKSAMDSRALVAVPSMNAEALNVVPMRKPKKSESAQRRIRRPFSVSEVEALVQAVEKLGTGRWRDVKLRAFDTAKHRTYVDLKDKWKTLVHTARISPQQRRGEPVPQELLDRVLMAHAYWSQQQAKQQLKQHSEACLL